MVAPCALATSCSACVWSVARAIHSVAPEPDMAAVRSRSVGSGDTAPNASRRARQLPVSARTSGVCCIATCQLVKSP